MYENGKQVNRHANKMKHKQNQKYVFLSGNPFPRAPGVSWKDYISHKKDHQSNKYWKIGYSSEIRSYASRMTSHKLRTEFRNDKAHLDEEDLYAPQHSEYKKNFDYKGTIY